MNHTTQSKRLARRFKRNFQHDNKSILNKNSNADSNLAAFFTIGLTIFTAVSFGAGKAYRGSYLSAFGIPDTVITLPFHEIIYIGLLKQASILIATPIIATYTIGLIVIIIALSKSILNRIQSFATKRARKHPEKQTPYRKSIGNNEVYPTLEAAYPIMMLSLVILFIGLSSFAFIIKASELGKTDAEEEIRKLSQNTEINPSLTLTTIERTSNGKTIIDTGFVIDCSERVCGLYTQKNNMKLIKIIPLDGATSFRSNSTK